MLRLMSKDYRDYINVFYGIRLRDCIIKSILQGGNRSLI